jgi:hypothetical protein
MKTSYESKTVQFSHTSSKLITPGMFIIDNSNSPRCVAEVEIKNDIVNIRYEGRRDFFILNCDVVEIPGACHSITFLNDKETEAAYFLQWLNRSGGIIAYYLENAEKDTLYSPKEMPGSFVLSSKISEMIDTLSGYDVPILIKHEDVSKEEIEDNFADLVILNVDSPFTPQSKVDIAKYENNALLSSLSSNNVDDCKPVNSITLAVRANGGVTTETAAIYLEQENASGEWIGRASFKTDVPNETHPNRGGFMSPKSAALDLGGKMKKIGEALIKKGNGINFIE